MPIGKLPRKQQQLSPHEEVSTLDSRMSSTDVPQMELLKINYVHQCKEAMMHKSNEPPPPPQPSQPPLRLNNPARFVHYRRHIQLASLSPNSARKPLPPPPPTVESWKLLQKQTTTTTIAVIPNDKRNSLPLPRYADSDCCSQSQASCSCSCSDSDATEASTVTPDCEKSHSWNYKGGQGSGSGKSPRDLRRDIARAGIRSRAERIACIESRIGATTTASTATASASTSTSLPRKEPNTRLRSNCVACCSPTSPVSSSRIPKPVAANTESNAQLQSRVKQLFQQNEPPAINAPKWMFQRRDSGGAGGDGGPIVVGSPRLQQKTKLERVHIRKKRQPLLIVNQLSGATSSSSSTELPFTTDNNSLMPKGACSSSSSNFCGYKSCNYSHHPMLSQIQLQTEDRLKRLSLESCSDSGVSSSNDCKDHHPQQQQQQKQLLRVVDKCSDCIKLKPPRTPPPMIKHKLHHIDPNDVQNFSKKNLTKPTTDELLLKAAASIKQTNDKQCNLQNERKLNNLQRSTTTITIDDSWIQEKITPIHNNNNDDHMDTDSLIIPSSSNLISSNNHKSNNNNSVKIFVSSPPYATSPDSVSYASNSSGISLDNNESDRCRCTNHLLEEVDNNCCNAIGGIFWNNSYHESGMGAAANCCCCCNNTSSSSSSSSISSCDEDDCSYYGGCGGVSASGASGSGAGAGGNDRRRSSGEELLIRNKKKVMHKTDGIHELRPRSMDGVVDSGVSLNGEVSSSPDSGEHMQNQQDNEARRLRRGHVLSELLETERIYVNEMSSILKGYCDQMQSEELMHLVPASLQGKEDILFGNLHELYTFHNDVFLKDLENCISTTELVALCFVQRRDTFYRLYSFYCQNIPRSERLRETLVDTHLFLQECQKRLGHKLPLAAYLLKPVQRITKYQLLLKDLLRFSDSGSCTNELQKALDCMLIVLKCVNDSMHQVAITGFPTDLAQQGELLLQDSFQVWTESKKELRMRIKPQQRHIFLYQKSMLFCKQTSKPGHNKSTYQFKHHVKMSQIGLTESVRGDTKRFEVWLKGRQEVHTMQAPTLDIKNKWVAEIKRVLFNQLEELKGEKIKQYGLNQRGLKQTTSWDTPNIILNSSHSRNISCDASSESSNRNSNCSSSDDCNVLQTGSGGGGVPGGNSTTTSGGGSSTTSGSGGGEKDQRGGNEDACGWSSDYSNSEDEISLIEDNSTPGSKFIALADYGAMGHSEVSIREGETIELLKVGCAGWWYVRVLDTNAEGWTPAAYLESINRKSSRSSSRNQERISLK